MTLNFSVKCLAKASNQHTMHMTWSMADFNTLYRYYLSQIFKCLVFCFYLTDSCETHRGCLTDYKASIYKISSHSKFFMKI